MQSSRLSQLPREVWEDISGFLQCRRLSHVCKKLWQQFHGQHIRCVVDSCNVGPILRQWYRTARTLTLVCNGDLGDNGVEAVALLLHAQLLQALNLHLTQAHINLPVLMALKDAASLHTLQLDLGGVDEDAIDYAADLVILKDMKSLRRSPMDSPSLCKGMRPASNGGPILQACSPGACSPPPMSEAWCLTACRRGRTGIGQEWVAWDRARVGTAE